SHCIIHSDKGKHRYAVLEGLSNYPISVSWDASPGGESAGEIEVFPKNHAIPFSKMLTFYRQEPFSIRAKYVGNIPYPDREIGTWTIKDIRPSAEGKPQKVKVKVRVNLHGIMTISSASLYEAKESVETESVEEPVQKEAQLNQQNSTEQQQSEAGTPMDTNTDAAPEVGSGSSWTKKLSAWFSGEGDKEKKKKQSVKSVELPIQSITNGFSQVELNQFTEQEFKMIASDKQEKERADARNAFEEYVYELRNKVSSEDELALYMLESNRDALVKQLDDMENWLYEDGEDCNKQVYIDKLAHLKSIGEPVQTRKVESELRPVVIEDFAKSLQLCGKELDLIRSNDAKYAHLTDEDVSKVDQAFKSSYQWLEQTRAKSSNAPKHLAPPITVAQIRQEKSNFENTVNSVLNKPPPKAPSPPKEDKNAGDQQKNSQEQSSEQNTQQNSEKQEENMEWSPTN
ncbi:hypothetical protein NQ315_013562, partial [Exocentrus adspersus]